MRKIINVTRRIVSNVDRRAVETIGAALGTLGAFVYLWFIFIFGFANGCTM